MAYGIPKCGLRHEWEWAVTLHITIPDTVASKSALNTPRKLLLRTCPNQGTWVQLFQDNKIQIPHPQLYHMEALRSRGKGLSVKSALHEKVCKLLFNYKRNMVRRPYAVHLILKRPDIPLEQQLIVPERRRITRPMPEMIRLPCLREIQRPSRHQGSDDQVGKRNESYVTNGGREMETNSGNNNLARIVSAPPLQPVPSNGVPSSCQDGGFLINPTPNNTFQMYKITKQRNVTGNPVNNRFNTNNNNRQGVAALTNQRRFVVFNIVKANGTVGNGSPNQPTRMVLQGPQSTNPILERGTNNLMLQGLRQPAPTYGRDGIRQNLPESSAQLSHFQAQAPNQNRHMTGHGSYYVHF